mgnify:FL=1
MDEEIRKNLTATDTWVRGVFMSLFVIIYTVAIGVWFLIVPFQFGHTLFVGKPSDPLLDFSENLCAYLYEILLYVSFSTEVRPFPLGPWPNERPGFVEEQVGVVDAEPDEPVDGTDGQSDDQREEEVAPPKASDEKDEPKDKE